MDYREVVKGDLRNLEAMRQGLRSVRERIRAIDAQLEGVGAACADAVAVRGGGNGREDKLVNLLTEKERLKLNYAAVRPLVKMTEQALEALAPEERQVLERMYIRRERGGVERLQEELGVSESGVWRLQRSGLREMAMRMYGIAEL